MEQGAWFGRVKFTRSVSTGSKHAEKLLTGWKKLWHQQLRNQVSQSEVKTEAIENAAASTANNYVDGKRLRIPQELQIN